jgi:hypothetical protein
MIRRYSKGVSCSASSNLRWFSNCQFEFVWSTRDDSCFRIFWLKSVIQSMFHILLTKFQPRLCVAICGYITVTLCFKNRCCRQLRTCRLIAQKYFNLATGGVGFNPRQGQWWDFFSSSLRPDRLWGPHSLLSNGYRGALTSGEKPSVREANHSPPSNVKAKNLWSYTSTPQCFFMALCFVKHRNKFTFTFTECSRMRGTTIFVMTPS